jgi:hypothetical protein
MTRAARSSLHVLRRKCRSRKRGPEAENRQGGAPRGARPDRKGRGAPRRVPGLQRHKRVHARLGRTLQANRVPLHPGACRRSAHPSIGVATEEANSEYDVGRKEKGKKEKGKRRRKKTEKKKWGEARFVGWAARASTPVCDGLWAHAERSTASPRARSRAPCPRVNGAARKRVGTARRSQACADCVNLSARAPIAPSKTGRIRP